MERERERERETLLGTMLLLVHVQWEWCLAVEHVLRHRGGAVTKYNAPLTDLTEVALLKLVGQVPSLESHLYRSQQLACVQYDTVEGLRHRRVCLLRGLGAGVCVRCCCGPRCQTLSDTDSHPHIVTVPEL